MSTLFRNILILCAGMLLISSCSTMNKSECLTADWKMIGFTDGANGYSASRISRHHSACAEHGITPNMAAYNKGRDQGLAQYCIPSKGYNNGLNGRSYNGICKGHNEAAFVDAFEFGLAVNKEQSILNQMKRTYSNEQDRIHHLKRKLKRTENKMTKGKLSELERYKLIQKTKRMAEELGAAKSGLGPLSDDIQQQERRVASMKEQRSY